MVGTTYIIRTISNEVYCGFTKNIKKRLNQHDSKQWKDMFIIDGNHEKKIKTFGVKRYFKSFLGGELVILPLEDGKIKSLPS